MWGGGGGGGVVQLGKIGKWKTDRQSKGVVVGNNSIQNLYKTYLNFST